ncbi:MAG: hypothetical protein HY540_03935 [Deltaproteobacteria bacterium]|nr:hypothetical protein [Deltaproteobacteria bacterium]
MKIKATLLSLLMISISHQGFAKMPKEMSKVLNERYPSAVSHDGLEVASKKFESEKIRSYVVVKKEGIPAEQARYFITWQEYEYRPAYVKEGKIKTRRGDAYTFLRLGDVMAVVDSSYYGKKIWLRLISPETYVPADRSDEKRFSRVTTKFGVWLPKGVWEIDDASAVAAAFDEWIMPFKTLDEAKTFSATLKPVVEGAMAPELKKAEEDLLKAQESLQKAHDKLKKLKEKQ